MKKLLHWCLPLLIVLEFVCILHFQKPHIKHYGVIPVALCEGNKESVVWWTTETARRFPDAVVIFGHGIAVVDGEWLIEDEVHHKMWHVEEVVGVYQKIYPDRPIVLICCNSTHLHLHIRGVWYSLQNVDMIPDKNVPEASVTRGPPPVGYGIDSCGNIFEFVED